MKLKISLGLFFAFVFCSLLYGYMYDRRTPIISIVLN